jgi:hypothetical protein
MVIICPHTKFHMPNSNGALVTTITLKAKRNVFVQAPCCRFRVYEKTDVKK